MNRLSAARPLIATIAALFQPLSVAGEERPGIGGPSHDGVVEITVVVDNHAALPALDTVWGFSCVVRGFEKTILFDTGKDGAILMRNLDKLDIAPGEIDVVVLSHAHRDHTGGLEALLAANPRVSVYLLSSFPKQLCDTIRNAGATPILVKEQTEICQKVYSTGELGEEIKEQSLVLRTQSGLVVITGCAHPGIVTILRQVKSAFPSSEDILVAMGGFHLIGSARFERIAKQIDAVGVRYIAPCHCTGKAAKRHLRRQFKERFVPLCAGVRMMLSGRVGKPCAETTCVKIPGR